MGEQGTHDTTEHKAHASQNGAHGDPQHTGETTNDAGPAYESADLEQATFGGGCFWCLEPLFGSLKGVVDVQSGYSGGHVANPSYQQVCTGTTGHAEVSRVTFDPKQVSYRDLLDVFFDVHDPTTPNRQGHDVGHQYRSVILYHSPEQKRVAEDAIARLAHKAEWEGDKVVTEVVPCDAFYPAEDYHNNYFELHGEQPYCRLVIAPKVAKFHKRHADAIASPS